MHPPGGTLVPAQVPVSAFKQPPAVAVYVPLAEFPSTEAVPESVTGCPFSLIWMVTAVPETEPAIVAETAHGLPAIAS